MSLTSVAFVSWLLFASWQFAEPYGVPALSVSSVLIAAACLAGLRGRATPLARLPPMALTVNLAGAIALTATLPFPYAIGPLLFGTATLLTLVSRRLLPRRIATALALVGVSHLAQAAVIGACHFLSGHCHTGALAGPLCAVLRVAGLDAVIRDDAVVLVLGHTRSVIVPSLSNAGIVWVAMALAATMIACAMARASLMRFVSSTVLVTMVAFLRYVLVVSLAYDAGRLEWLWGPWPTIVSFAAVFLLIPVIIGPSPHGAPRAQTRAPTPRRAALAAVAVALGAALGGLAIGFHDPGSPRSGPVLIDEAHSDWEWTDEELDTEWYGPRSTYNFWSFAVHLGRYYPLRRNYMPLAPETLKPCSTVVLKTPTRPYALSEVRALLDFVESGGGLVLIGDHTNVFGSSQYLNDVARPVGIEYMYDSQYELGTGRLSFYAPPRLAPHPAVRNVPPLLFAGGCTLRGSAATSVVMVGYRNQTLPGDYSQRAFFPARGDHHDFRFGAVFQALAASRGKGRVVAFTDSTMFSSFFMHMRGKPELALGLVEWAHRENRYGWVAPMAAAAAVLLLLLGLPRLSVGGLQRVAGPVLLGITIGLRGSTTIAAATYPLPTPPQPIVEVAFESQHSSFFVPDERLRDLGDNSFDSFYVWTQRLGYAPVRTDTLAEAMERGKVVVVINPCRRFSDADLAASEKYVREGGSLLVMDAPSNERSTANALLGAFDVRYDRDVTGVVSEDAPLRQFLSSTRAIVGCTPVLTARSDQVVIGHKPWGHGRLVVCGNSDAFGELTLGSVCAVPTERQRAHCEVEFRLMRYLARESDTLTLEGIGRE